MHKENPPQRRPRTESRPKTRSSRIVRSIAGYLLHCIKVLSISAIAIAALLYAFVQLVVLPATPEVDDLQAAKSTRPSVVLDSEGDEIVAFRRGQQEWIPLKRISPYVVEALIATEDHRFYEHRGVDIGRTVAALFHTASGDTQGGSTITQQLARNLFPEEIGRSRNAMRKLKEIFTAIKIEKAYSKAQVLETYLNTVPFLYNVFGIEMAARTYFDKPASALDQLEAATLVGMLKGTHYYNPVVNPERARARRNVVLTRMAKYRMLPAEQLQALRDKPLELHFNRLPEQTGSSTHFSEYVRKWLLQWADENDYDLYSDGLVAYTTLDKDLQETAERAVQRQTQALQNIADVEWGRKSDSLLSTSPSAYAKAHKHIEPFSYFWSTHTELLDSFIRETPQFKKAISTGMSDAKALAKLKHDAKFMADLRANKTRLEAGFVAIDPATGEVKAWVGSRDFERDQYDHVAQALRQPGSTFKPIVYGAALEQGFSPERAYRDRPVEIRFADGEVWKPTDMSAPSGRTMTLREGLIFSKNTITAQLMQDVGLVDIINMAKSLGINQSKLDPVPSLALGTSPVTLLEMVSAYATIAQSGEYRKPVFVRKITDRNGKVIAQFGKESKRAMSENTAIELIDMMRGVISRGTGQAIKAQIGVAADIAGKTGTTQYNTDGWFILMHPNLVAGSWVGFNDSRVTMRSNHWGQGGHNALLLVGDFFRDALKEKLIDPKAKFPRPKRQAATMVRNHEATDDYTPGSGSADSGIFVHRDADGTVLIGDEQALNAASREQAPGGTAQDFNHGLSGGMGRNAATASGAGADIDVRAPGPAQAAPAQSPPVVQAAPAPVPPPPPVQAASIPPPPPPTRAAPKFAPMQPTEWVQNPNELSGR